MCMVPQLIVIVLQGSVDNANVPSASKPKARRGIIIDDDDD